MGLLVDDDRQYRIHLRHQFEIIKKLNKIPGFSPFNNK
jgi:hypothetical protein